MLVLFQIFLMTARSSSLACSRLPAAQVGAARVTPQPSAAARDRERSAKECDADTFRFDLEGRAHQGEQGGVEHDGAVAVEWHVHGNQPLQEESDTKLVTWH